MAEQGEPRPWEQIPAGFYADEPGCNYRKSGSATDQDPHLRRFFGVVAAETAGSDLSPCLK
jgi:hypothetical protein